MSVIDQHHIFMSEALRLAAIAAQLGEVPVGAVVVKDGVIIGRGYNRRELSSSVLEHAELNAIKEAASVVGNWRLMGAIMYSSLEPCIMCAGALVHARVAGLFYGAADGKFGGIESLFKIGEDKRLNHQFVSTGGVMADESVKMLKQFFHGVRLARK